MYNKAYGVIETLAPVHVGATAGEETGNLNLIFRDQFTQTGIIPGSSIRGRFRADLRDNKSGDEQIWYGHESVDGRPDGGTTEALVKFEYASIVWLPVFCPGQPVVWVTSPLLLKRYKRIAKIEADVPQPYSAMVGLEGRQIEGRGKILFFNLGFIEIKNLIKTEDKDSLSAWIPPETDLDINKLVVVSDKDIAMLHDMALYRQSRVKLLDTMKKVDTERGAFFNVEALPEGSILVFPIALKQTGWKPFGERENLSELYFGGLESIGFGRCRVSLAGDY
ncbi:RAMP superfamily CRISPR-associated protein [Microcoleus sp. S36b_A3]|uniref:RAMP superfamily CRISPR-associated protein n=1 Tax=unclassified Microcoleus TaxID=2642155 RepID=UPI002FCFB61F